MEYLKNDNWSLKSASVVIGAMDLVSTLNSAWKPTTDDESAFEDEDEDAFDVDAFFNEMNPTINDAGFGNGFVPDEDNM